MFIPIPILVLSGLLLSGPPQPSRQTDSENEILCGFHDAIVGRCSDLRPTARYRLEFPEGWQNWFDPEIYSVNSRLAPPAYHLTATEVVPLTSGWTTTHRGSRKFRWQIESWQVTSSDFLEPAPDAHAHVQILLSWSKPRHRQPD